MKWLKFSKAFGDHAVDAVTQVEDSEAAFLTKSGVAAETTAPASVAAKTAELSEALIDRLSAKMLDGLERVQAKGKGNRPGYSPVKVEDDNKLADPTDGFKTASEYFSAVRKACQGHGTDDRLLLRLKANGASENINADGGYATPIQYATTVYNDVIAQDSLFNSCTTIPMESNSMKLPALNYTQQGSFGVTANWEGEGANIPISKTNYRQPQLTLNKLTILTPVTSELLEDGIAVESTINFLASQAITYKVNDAIINGTGVGQPVGIVGHASTAVITRNTTQAVKSQDVISMESALIDDFGRGVWLINKVAVNPQLLTIQDAGGRYLYFAPGTFGDVKGPANMLGKPVRPLINCQGLGTKGDIIAFDPKTYAIGYKSTGVSKAMSIHLYFATDEVAYRWTMRMDGRPWRDTTLAAANGTGVYSGAVVLSTL